MSAVLERPLPAVKIVNVLNIEAVKTAHRQTVLRTAEFEDPRDGRRFRVGYSSQKQNQNLSPPHRHTFDQVRFVVKGATRYGPLRLHGGDFAYFPEGVFYGPTEPLSEEITGCTIQTQGPSWGTFPTDAECAVAIERLKPHGELDRATGQFVWKDGRKQDSFEAMLENLVGGPADYPEGRFRAPVQFRTEAFPWIPADREPGVHRKQFARFNAGGPDIELIRLAPGAALPAGALACHRLMVLFSGAARYENQSLTEGTYVYCPPDIERAAVRAEQETVIFSCRFEALGRPLPG